MRLTQRRLLIERLRTYLRRHDLIQGYLPQLAMPEPSSDWWCLLWYCIRRIDTFSDTTTPMSKTADPLAAIKSRDATFEQALELFLKETVGLVPRSLLREMYASIALERRLFSNGHPPNLAQYLALMDQKAVVPVKICAILNDLDIDTESGKQLVTGLGRAAQLMDDLLDLRVDLASGRLFITAEELKVLNLSPDEIMFNLDKVARLRNKWILQTSWEVYEIAGDLPNNSFALVARSWIEGIWRLIATGKSVPLHPTIIERDGDFAHYMGASSLPFDIFPGTELLKYRLFHPVMVSLLRHYSVFDYVQARQVFDQLNAPIEELLALTHSDWSTASKITDQTYPRRELINLDNGLGLRTVFEEFPQIVQKAAKDSRNKVLVRFSKGDVLSGAVELAADSVDVQHAIDLNGIEEARKTVVKQIHGDQPMVKGLVDLGFDFLSILRDHQHSFQKELLNWLGTQSRSDHAPR